MMVSIFSMSKYLTYLGGFSGGQKGEKVSKTVYPHSNKYQMLKFSTSKLFQIGNFTMVSIFNTRGVFRTQSNIQDGVF